MNYSDEIYRPSFASAWGGKKRGQQAPATDDGWSDDEYRADPNQQVQPPSSVSRRVSTAEVDEFARVSAGNIPRWRMQDAMTGDNLGKYS
jgi:hypothetical protein